MKKIISAILILAMAASMASCGDSSKTDDGDYIYGQIESISGNDVVVQLAEYNEKSDDSQSDDESSSSDSSGSRKSRGDFNPGDFSGSMPDGFDPEKFAGSRPDRSDDSDNSGNSNRPSMPGNFDGSMPDGFDPKNSDGSMPDGFDSKNFDGSMPEGLSRPDGAGRQRSGKSGNSQYSLTGEKQELRIPVGTSVTTSDGVKSNFDALKKGDIIKCSVEKNDDGQYTVKEVWIVQQ